MKSNARPRRRRLLFDVVRQSIDETPRDESDADDCDGLGQSEDGREEQAPHQKLDQDESLKKDERQPRYHRAENPRAHSALLPRLRRIWHSTSAYDKREEESRQRFRAEFVEDGLSSPSEVGRRSGGSASQRSACGTRPLGRP